jgi:P-type Cu2+ transporter
MEAKKREVSPNICLHCRLPVPAHRKHLKGGNDFCCNGCASVYRLLKENNLDYFYDLQKQDASGGIPATEAEDAKDFGWFDSPEFQDYHVHTSEEGNEKVAKIELFLEGIHCPACVWLLEKSPQIIPGLYGVRVDLSKSVAEVQYLSDRTTLSAIAAGFTRLGYRPHPFRGQQFARLRKKIEKTLLLSLGIAGACAGNVMIVSICLYAGIFGAQDVDYQQLFRWTAFAVSIPSVFWSARVFYKRAFAALMLGQVHLDVPVSIGILTAFIGSAIQTMRGSGEIYFDSVTVIIFLLLISRFLQFRAQHRAQDKTEMLFSLLPAHVHLSTENGITDVSLDAVRKDDVIEVFSGEVIPVDGIVQAGESLLDCSVINGESAPIHIRTGFPVYAGMKNISSPLSIAVTSTGDQTRIGRLSRLASDMQKSRPAVLHLVDRLSKWFVLFVCISGGLAFFLGYSHGVEEAFERLIALCIISCPCALGMATPLALSVALGNAARSGIHLRSTTAIEQIAKAKNLIFDKTGTLTKGDFRVYSIWGDESYIPLVISLEKFSSHVIAKSIISSFRDVASATETVSSVEEVIGKGIQGDVSGVLLQIGNSVFMSDHDVVLSSEAREEASRVARNGCTPVYVAIDGVLRMIIGMGDPLYEGVHEMVRDFQKRFRLYILSGDVPEVVYRIADKLSIPVSQAFGGMSPEDKVEKVRVLSSEASSIFFGDGSNDAAALATASAGIAMHGGAEASYLVADGFLSRPDIRLVSRLVHGSGKSMRVVYRGLLSSLLFNLTGCTLAVLGYISPLVAALIMPASSLIVVVLAFTQKSFLRD